MLGRVRLTVVVGAVVAACSSSYGSSPSDGVPSEAGPGDPDAALEPPVGDSGTPEIDAGRDGSTTEAGPSCLPPKKPDDAGCTAPVQCCSGSCVFGNVCGGPCNMLAATCESNSNCCSGLWCGGVPKRCNTCVPPGGQADGFSPFFNADSCCSRSMKFNGVCN